VRQHRVAHDAEGGACGGGGASLVLQARVGGVSSAFVAACRRWSQLPSRHPLTLSPPRKALHHAQSAYFVTIVVVQWADLLICKTRWLSITTQGLRNSTLNFGLFFETLLAAWLCYCPAINMGLGTRNMRLVHWLPGLPWSCLIFVYDEARKALMRATSPESVDAGTGQVYRKAGWLERNTYY